MRTVYPPPPPPAPAVSAASTPARRCAPSRTIARTRAGSVRLILSYSAVSDTGSVAPAALTTAWIDGRNPNVTEASKSTTVENSSDRTYCRSACWANSASSHGAASARRSVRCVITVSGLRLRNRSTTASHPIRHLPTPRQRYLAGGHLERGGSNTCLWGGVSGYGAGRCCLLSGPRLNVRDTAGLEDFDPWPADTPSDTI